MLTKLDQYDEKVMLPWFKFERPKQEDNLIIFGHWASLGRHFENRAYGIDSGCVWEGELSLMRVDQDLLSDLLLFLRSFPPYSIL
ncbi:hypothetical protein [Ignatzschineria indica]|uniref:hypothetical protein n=1 Tax=Ignatzschineria indica TaxID=472583 RepID=UPI00362B6623